MIRSLFINKEALEKGANRPKVADQSVKKLGVIGAGMMGAGIAYVSANAGIDVVLIDATQEAADRGKAHSEELVKKDIQKGKTTRDDGDKTSEAKIRATKERKQNYMLLFLETFKEEVGTLIVVVTFGSVLPEN